MAILYIGLNSVKKMDKTATKGLLICLADFRLALARRPTRNICCAVPAWADAKSVNFSIRTEKIERAYY